MFALLELADQGNLRDFLQRHKAVSVKQLLSFSWQVARGMEHLSSCGCVHRDLAARNILLTRALVAKVADFGLAKDLEGESCYTKLPHTRVPFLWMSPESIFEGVYSSSSDVWAFGVLLMEIITWGERPYKGVQCDALPGLLKSGYRMDKPSHCPQEFYEVMLSCWAQEPGLRPPWSQLVSVLHSQFSLTLPGVYLVLPPPSLGTPPSSPRQSSLVLSGGSSSVSSASAPDLFLALPLSLSHKDRRVSETSGYSSGGTEDSERPNYYNQRAN